MADYRPQLDNPIPLLLFVPTYETVQGVSKKRWPEEGELFYGNFKTYGGTERDVNGIFSVIDTANIETWFRPDIKSDCRIARAEDRRMYEIVGEPEDVNSRHQFLKIKVRAIKGNA